MSAVADTQPISDADTLPTAVGSVNARGRKLIWRFMTTHPGPTVVSVIGAVVFSAAAVGSTVAVGAATDNVIAPAFAEGVEKRALWVGVSIVVVIGVVRGLSVVIRRYFAAMLEARMQATLRRGVVDQYLRLPIQFHQSRPTGSLLAHADADVSGTTMLIKPLPFSIGLVTLVGFSLISLFAVDWTFALTAIALFPLLTVINRIYTAKVEAPSARVQQELGNVSAVAHESFEGALVVKTLGRSAEESERFAAAADTLRKERLVVGSMRASFEPIIEWLPSLGTIGLLLLGAWRIDSGAVSEGDLVQAALLFSILGFPMRVFGFFLEELPRAVVSIERVDGVLDHPTGDGAVEDISQRAVHTNEPTEHPLLPSGPLGLKLSNVSFSYGDVEVLSDITLDIAPGETVALVGATGSGKSTLNQLLVGLALPTSGDISIGGVPLETLTSDELRSAVGLVFQEAFLFATSVRDNISLDSDARVDQSSVQSDSDEVVQRAADVAQVTRFIHELPQGWDTVLGERGVTLSGGQRQRVALARALARSPRLLILDDATSAVDPTVEAEILEGLGTTDATVLVIAHRLSTIALADRVAFLEDGSIRAIGTHEELLAIEAYATLVQAYEADEVGSGE